MAAPCHHIFLFWVRKYYPIYKIRQSKLVKGINIYGNEVKLSQFANESDEDITSVDKALCLVNDFAPVSGLKLKVKKTKALWLGKWRNNRTKPLQLSWRGNLKSSNTSKSPHYVELKESHFIWESFDH